MNVGKDPLVIYLGDHDPSGIDMTRDIRDRLILFGVDDVEVSRIALNEDQVRHYSPPPNPAKLTDSRAKDYVNKFGYESWELDALEPSVLGGLIADRIQRVIDYDLWVKALNRAEKNRKVLTKFAKDLKTKGGKGR